MSVTKENLKTMKISEIAALIVQNWEKISPHARPYLDAMQSLSSVSDSYYMDSGASVVSYFLGNAQSFRGEVAKLVKAELNVRLKAYYK